MPKSDRASRLSEIIERTESDVLNEWLRYQQGALRSKTGAISESALREESARFLGLFSNALRSGGGADLEGPVRDDVRHMLSDLSRSRAMQGFTPVETATFVFSLKQPLFDRLRREIGGDAQLFAEESWAATQLLIPTVSAGAGASMIHRACGDARRP